MSINGFRNSIKQISFYIPFTLYFVLFAVAAAFGWNLLYGANYQPETSFADIFLLLIRIAGWFTLILISFALVSVLLSPLCFLWFKKKRGIDFQLSTDLKESEVHQKQTVRLLVRPVFRPLFGFVKLRLQYDQKHYSSKFSLLENSGKSFFSNTIEGVYHWPLPEIKEYHVQKAILYFEDFFQFFSIAVDLPASNNFYTQPTAQSIHEFKVFPRKTEETTTRIEELRRVEGEYLNYKNFENNDDVRRIVWKIYAKNKELVVRIPEITDPYASHVYLYASYFTSFNIAGNNVVEVPFLNYYKILTWTMYQDLVKQGFEVKYIADQDVAKKNEADEQQAVKYIISTSNWHSNKDLRSYVNTRDAAVIIISSLSNAEQLEELAEKYGNDIRFMFIKLTDSLRKQNAFDWVQWVFVRNQDNDLESYKRLWSLSSLRPKIAENERRIEEVMKKYQLQLVK
jgi:hypothetical protein